MKVLINYWAVIASALLSTGLMCVWYLVLFPVPYVKALDRTKEQMDKGPTMGPSLLIQVAGNLVMIFVLAWLMSALQFNTVGKGVLLAALIWCGFVASVIGPMYAFQAFPMTLFLITTGSILMALLVSAVVLGAWH